MIVTKLGLLVLTLSLSAAVRVGFAEPLPRQPQDGVLLLKHGTTLSGLITRAGDRYIVLLGESGEARVPSADVAAVVGSFHEAYQYKQSKLDESLVARIDLAQWCLQHQLPARAADQVLAAERLYGRQPSLEAIHQRLITSARLPRVAKAGQNDEKALAKVNYEEELRSFPANTIDLFTSAVQPLLLNRCAAGGCHNNRGTSEYILFRPFFGQATTRRLTERNLIATLAYVDRTEPLQSKLLLQAAVPHGGAAAAIEEREKAQLEILAEWLGGLGARGRPSEPITIAPANNLLYQAGRLPSAESSKSSGTVPMAQPPSRIVEKIGDPFDPDIFNQRYHGRTR